MNYTRMDFFRNTDFRPDFGSKYKITTTISDGGIIGQDTERPKNCAECIYHGCKKCPANMKHGKCALTKRRVG